MQRKCLAIDIETADWGYPCEIALAEIRDSGVFPLKSWLVKPSCYPAMNPEMESIHGISSERLKDAPTLKDIWGEISCIINRATLVGHNIRFDIGAIKKELERYGITCRVFPCVCTLEQSRIHLNIKSHKLLNVCRHLGIEIKNHHSALSDAEAAARIFIKLPKTGIKLMNL
jgi:DNA polymerase-3 subunit epsilon